MSGPVRGQPVRLRALSPQLLRLAAPGALGLAAGLLALPLSSPQYVGYYLAGLAVLAVVAIAALDFRLVLYTLVIFLPLETIGPVGIIQSKLAKLAVMLVLVAFELARRAIRRDTRWRSTPYDWFIVAYLLSGTVSTALSMDPGTSAQSVVQSALIFSLFWIVANRVRSERAVQWLMRTMLIVAVLVAVYGVLQKTFGFDAFGSVYIRDKITRYYYVMGRRLFSVMNNPNALGGYMGTMLPIALAYLALGKLRARWRYVLLVAIALMALNVVWAASRGAMVGTILALIVLTLLLRRNRLTVILLSTVLLIFGAALAYMQLKELRTYLRVFSSWDITLAGRPEIWRTAIRVAMDHLPFGIGYYMWKIIYPTYGLILWKPTDDAHNLILNMFVEQGIPGILLFVWFVAAFLSSSIRLVRQARTNPTWYPFAVGMLGAGVSRLAHETVEADTLLGVSSVVEVFWVLLALQTAVRYIVARERQQPSGVPSGGGNG